MNFNKRAYLIEIAGILLYIILITIGMFTYSGGTRYDSTLPGYSFWGNTFSDLGRTVAYNGNSNIISMILFSIAYFGISLTFLPFYYAFPNLFENETVERKNATIGSIFGLLSSIFFIGVVATPADLLRPPHMILAIMAYACIFFMGVFYTFSIKKSAIFSNFYFYVFLLFSIVFFVTLMFQLMGIIIDNRILGVTGQKIARISLFAAFLILTYGAWKLEK